MTTRVQCGFTAGIAIVGASVLAVAPLAAPMPFAQGNRVTPGVELAAASDALQILAAGVGETGQNAAHAAALSPLSAGLDAIGLALGDNALTYSVIRQSIDAPLWAADPTINALAKVLPAPLGGGVADNKGDQPEDGALVQFRDDVLWATTNAVRTPIGEFLDVDPTLNDNPATTVGSGLLQSGERFAEGAVLAPLGLIPIVQAIANGSQQDLYNAIRQYIDAPLWVADLTINALADVLPKPIGGGTADNMGDQKGDGALVQFRDDVLWNATNTTRTAVANVLGAEANPGLTNTSLARDARTDDNKLVLGNGNLGKFMPGSGAGNAAAANTTNRPQPVRTAIKTVNDQVKAGAEQLGQTAKKLAGANDKKAVTADKN